LKASFLTIALILLLALALQRDAHANLVQNGDFTSITYSGTLAMTTLYGQFGTDGGTPASGSTLTVTGWTTGGYNFVYAPNTADAGTSANGANAGQPNEAPGQFNAANGYGNTYMYGSNNGGVATLPSTSPAGGNFIAMDGAYEIQAVSQTITGLKVGQIYVLTFYWAGAQQQGFTGTTTESLIVSLGTESFTTGTVTVASGSFSGWMQQTFVYTATGTSETLSFLAAGTPNGEPPFSLVGGVDLEVVPDFSNWIVFAGFGTTCILFETLRRRRHRRKSNFGPGSGTALAGSLPNAA